MTGSLAVSETEAYEGLGIVPFYMWNATSDYTNFYFGANFVDHIDHIKNHLAMVVPANGKNYDSFIFRQYFATTIAGSNAMTQETLAVIAIINALPDNITLDSEAAIVAARAAYDQITSHEQLALITNYSELINAETTLAYLKLREEGNLPGDSSSSEENPDDKPEFSGDVLQIVLIVVLGVVALGAVAYIVLDKTVLKKKSEKTSVNESKKDEE